MGTPKLPRELLIANVALARGVAGADRIADAFRRFWEQRTAEGGGLIDALAAGGVDRAQLDGVQLEVERLIEAAGGDVYRALADHGLRDAIHLTLHTHAAAGRREPDVSLRRVPESRFTDFLIAGQGGMGVVYMAFDTELNRFVALKMIRPPNEDGTPTDVADSPLEIEPPSMDTESRDRYGELKQRFLQEAWITGGLEHPGIVPVYELGQTERGMPFYTMRFVTGHRTLSDAIDDAHGAGGIGDRVALLEPFLKVCDAVEFAHARGIIHRDLKPSNVALGEYGEVLVLDWGLARIGGKQEIADEPWAEHVQQFRETEGFETNVSAVGTPGYMAPEAALGDGVVDHRADVYSLGAMLYEILTGRLPHKVPSFAQWIEALARKQPIEDAAHVDPKVPAGLSAIAASALAWSADQRPAHAGALAERVRAWQVADAEARELDRLERDARDAVESAQDAKADDRIRAATRALLLLRQVADRRPSEELTLLEADAERLRQVGLRERTWAMARRPVLALGMVLLAIGATLFVVKAIGRSRARDAVDAALARAATLVTDGNAELGIDEAETAHRLLEGVAADAAADDDWLIDRRVEHFRVVCDAQARKADLPALARLVSSAFGTDDAPREHAEKRADLARCCGQLGLHEVVRRLLSGESSLTQAEKRLLLEAHCWLQDAPAAHDTSRRFGDDEAQGLLRRFSVLADFEVPGAHRVHTTRRTDGTTQILVATHDGRLLRLDPMKGVASTVPFELPLQRLLITDSPREDHVTAVGVDAQDVVHIAEVDLGTGRATTTTTYRKTYRPMVRRMDLDGDGRQECVLSYGAAFRGVVVLDADLQPWPRSRLGDLADIEEGRVNVDFQDVVQIVTPSGPLLLFGTATWDAAEHGYRVLAYRWDADRSRMQRAGDRRLGHVQTILQVPPGVATSPVYLWNSFLPMTEYGSVVADFVSPGIHRLDPETLEVQGVATWPAPYFRSVVGDTRVTPIYWTFDALGAMPLADGKHALLSVAQIGGASTQRRRFGLQLLVPTGVGPVRPWVVPGLKLGTNDVSAVFADVSPAHAGQEAVLAISGERIAVLGSDDRVPAAPAPTHGADPLAWRFAEGLRADGWSGAAAEVYEEHESAGLDPATRWGHAVACWLEALETRRARAALDEALARGAFSKLAGAYWRGRIAEGQGRRLDAVAAYKLVEAVAPAGRSAGGPLEEDARRRLGSLTAADRAFVHRVCVGSEPATTLATTRPLMAARDVRGRGLRTALHGQLPVDSVGFRVQASNVEAARVWARVIVEEEQYGGQLCLGFSQSDLPYAEPGPVRQDSAWLSLFRGDAQPRGIDFGFRVGRKTRNIRDDARTGRKWDWGRPLLLQMNHDGKDASLEFTVRDERTGDLIAQERVSVGGRLHDGVYQVGLWATHRTNPWSSRIRLIVQEIGCEILPGEDGAARLLPPPAEPKSATLLRDAVSHWREHRDPAGAARMLVDAIADDVGLAELFAGPTPESVLDLVVACMALRPKLGRALLRTSHDGDLLADLYLSKHLGAETAEERKTLYGALMNTGHIAVAWELREKIAAPDPGRALSDRERVRLAAAFFEDGAKLQEFLQPVLDGPPTSELRWEAIRRRLLGALVREEHDAARRDLGLLLRWPVTPPAPLMDTPAIRRFAERIGKR